MSPDVYERARREFESTEVAGRYGSPPPPNNRALYWATAAILVALALVIGFSAPCDHEFWGGLKVGLGAVCQ